MLENKIKLHSRYSDVITTFTPIDENSGVLLSNGAYVRTGINDKEDALSFVDFEGGPMLSVGDSFNNKKIKSIKSFYYVELE